MIRRAPVFLSFATLVLCFGFEGGTRSAWGQARAANKPADPTQLSPQISKLLEGIAANNAKRVEATDVEDDETREPEIPLVIRLRGLVMRSPQRGMAILVMGEERVVIPLDREKLANTQIAIGGQQYALVDFQPHGIQLRNVTTAETLQVN